MKEKLKRTDSKKFILMLFSFVFTIVVVFSIADFYWQSKRSMREEAFGYLEGAAELQSLAISTKLDGQYYLLQSFAARIASSELEREEIVEQMLSITKIGEFRHMCVSDADGLAFFSNGVELDISDRDFFDDVMAGERAVRKLEVPKSDGVPCFTISVPLKTDDGIKGVVCAGVNEEVFAELLAADMFSGESYCFMTDSQGGILARASSGDFHLSSRRPSPIFSEILSRESNGDFPETIFGFHPDASGESGERITDIPGVRELLENMRRGDGGGFTYEYGDVTNYIVYSPLGISDWYVFNCAPSGTVNERLADLSPGIVLLAVKIAAACAAMLIVIFIVDRRSNNLLRKEKELLRRSEEKYRIVESMSDSIMFEVNLADGSVRFGVNFEKLFKRKPYMDNLSDCENPMERVHEADREELRRLIRSMTDGVPKAEGDIRIMSDDGAFLWFKLEYTLLKSGGGESLQVLGRMTNIDKDKRKLLNLQIKADSDSLTKLYNHDASERLINDYLESEGKDGLHALYVLDIDNFKELNDLYGHLEGDNALVAVAGELRKLFRTYDIIGRPGGDEFIIFLKDIGSRELVSVKAREMCDNVSKIRLPGAPSARVTCSVGAEICEGKGRGFAELYEKADKAMYRAKKIGKNCFAIND